MDRAESSAASAPRVPLSSGEELTEEFEAVLRTIFERFDVDKDGLLSVAELKKRQAAGKLRAGVGKMDGGQWHRGRRGAEEGSSGRPTQ